MEKIVLKRKFVNYFLLYLLACILLGAFISTLVLTILKQIEMVIVPIIIGILFILLLLGLIDIIRTRIIIEDNELIIKKNIFKTINININSIKEVSISLFYNKQKRSVTRRVLFYDKKNNIIAKINSFEIDRLDNFEDFISYLEKNNVVFTRKFEEITVDIKKNMIIVISASFLTIILFLIILVFLDTRFNSYKKTKNEELIYVNNKITNIEQSDDLKIYFNENEYYVIPSFLDLNRAIHVGDELEIHYKKVNNENVIYVLYDNNILYYSYEDFMSKTAHQQNMSRLMLLIVILVEIGAPFIFYFALTKTKKIKQNYYNSLDSKYKIDINGIRKYKLTNFKETVKFKKELERHMLSKIIMDGISYFIIEYENKKDVADYYIGYSYCGKKALIDAFIEDNMIFLDDNLNFSTNLGTTEFLDVEKKIFESNFQEIENITKHKPYYMSQYDEIETIDQNKEI